MSSDQHNPKSRLISYNKEFIKKVLEETSPPDVTHAQKLSSPPSQLIAVYELPGTGLRFPGINLGGPPLTADWLSTALDHNKFSWSLTETYDWIFPMGVSIDLTVQEISAKITANPTQPFILVGTSQGAAVISHLYDALRYGNLRQYNSLFLAGFTFGNPRRQPGHTFPTYNPDPSGAGIDPNQLFHSEARWWDFANPYDPAACCGNTECGGTTVGLWMHNLWQFLNNDFSGLLSDFVEFIENPMNACFGSLGALWYVFTQVVQPAGAHRAYWSTFKPLGDGRTAGQICIDEIKMLA
jgi:pimeloyl-ACP methyl ester carboxylesterase